LDNSTSTEYRTALNQTTALAEIRNHLKKFVFWGLLLLPVLASLEIAAYVITKRAVPSRILYRGYGGESIDRLKEARDSGDWPKIVKAAATVSKPDGLMLYDHELGWAFPPGLV
jgi:hypothetical protein